MILLVSAAIACPEPTEPAALADSAARARAAFSQLDAAGFAAAVVAVEDGIPCLRQALSAQQAAELHTVRALASFLQTDEVSTGASFQAALAAQPTLALDWLPPTHPIHFELRYAERTMTDARRALQPPDGVVVVDGHLTGEVVPERPAILQHQQGGAVTDSVLVLPGQALPDWAPLAPEPLSPAARRRLWLGGVTTAAALTTGGLVTRSVRLRAEYFDPTTPQEDLSVLEAKTNRTIAGSLAAAGATAGLGAALVVTW